MKTNLSLDGRSLTCFFLIILAVATRVVPHPAGVTSVGAIGLFSGAYLGYRRAWLVPVAALLLSDIFIGFYEPLIMLAVYGGFALSAIIGRIFLFQKRSVLRAGGATLAGAVVFFILSNLGVWGTGLHYPLTIAGMVECYLQAVPFFWRTLLGDMFYVAVLFGSCEFIQARLDHWRATQSA